MDQIEASQIQALADIKKEIANHKELATIHLIKEYKKSGSVKLPFSFALHIFSSRTPCENFYLCPRVQGGICRIGGSVLLLQDRQT